MGVPSLALSQVLSVVMALYQLFSWKLMMLMGHA